MATSPANSEMIPIRPVKSGPPARTYSRKGQQIVGLDLTRQQRAFINYYLEGNTARKSALLAGYSESTANNATDLLLYHPTIYKEIRKRVRARFEAMDVNANRVIEEAAKMAFANILDYIELNEDGSFKGLNLKLIDRELGSAIQEIYIDPDGRTRIKLVDKKSSLELLARLLKVLGNETPGGDNPGAQQPLTIQSFDLILQRITINNNNTSERRQLPKTVDAVM